MTVVTKAEAEKSAPSSVEKYRKRKGIEDRTLIISKEFDVL